MSDNIYDVFKEPPATAPQEKPRLSTVEWAAKKQAERDNAYGDIANMTEQIQHSPLALETYLTVQSRFPMHSVNNTMLIAMQDKNAKRIGSYDYWRQQGGTVLRNPNPIFILEPNGQYERKDGSIGTNFDVKRVYDISQTNLRYTPPIRYDIRTKLLALIKRVPADIQVIEKMENGEPAILFRPQENEIHVTQGLSPEKLFTGISRELAHASFAGKDREYDRSAHDLQAMCASFMLCKRYGVDISGFDLSEVSQALSGMDQRAVNSFLDKPRTATEEISGHMEKVFAEIKQPAQTEQSYGR